MTEVVTISDPYRAEISASKRPDGGVLIRSPKAWLQLSGAEIDRLIGFVRNEPHIQRYPVMAPESPETDE
jgi:hypothetical protein